MYDSTIFILPDKTLKLVMWRIYFYIILNMSYILTKGKDKKYNIKQPDGDIIKFGQRGASDFTIHKDKKR